MLKKMAIFCLMCSLCVRTMDQEIQISPTVHQTDIGRIGSFKTETFVAFIHQDHDARVEKVMGAGPMRIPDDYNTRVSQDGRRFFCEMIDPTTNIPKIAYSNAGENFATVLDMPDESNIKKKINPAQFLWTTDPEGKFIYMLCNEESTDATCILRLELMGRGCRPALFTTIGSRSFQELMRTSSSRMMTADHYTQIIAMIEGFWGKEN